jgi:hypothetical protein
MRAMLRRIIPLGVLAALGAFGLTRLLAPAPMPPLPQMEAVDFAAAYASPLEAPEGPVAVYHLGHSLVGRDMPAMLAQLAGHEHASQLGWGASLRQHWLGDVPGFEQENASAAFRPAAEALDSGGYGAVVLTEMVEIRDAIRYHDSARHLALWAAKARAARPDARVYLYETWHRLEDAEGWLNRLDADLARYWEDELLRRALTQPGVAPLHVIPGGQVMAALVRAIDAGTVPGLTRREDLFALNPDGTPDPIHLNDLGAYVIALTHFAVLYHQSPEGLPHQLTRADGTPADALPDAAVPVVQQLVWRVVTGYPATGVAPAES